MNQGHHDGGVRLALNVGVAFCGLAVGLGAFGAHGLQLEGKPEEWYATAVQYQMFHGLALLACSVLGQRAAPGRATIPAWCFTIGATIFAGTLYAMALGAPRWFGAITPVGGVLLLVGWLAMFRLGTVRRDPGA